MGFDWRDLIGPNLGDPRRRIPENLISHKDRQRYRRTDEEAAENIHPLAGKVVAAVNNLEDTLENAMDSVANGVPRLLFAPEVKRLRRADHLFVQRVGFTHHGLYLGRNRVIHYADRMVYDDTLENFAGGARIHRMSAEESPISYSVDEVIARAFSRIGEYKYNLFLNNCENFVRWCRNGGVTIEEKY